MDQLLADLKESVQDEYEWVANDTMIDLFLEPNISDPDESSKYDLSLLIGHKKKTENTKFDANNVRYKEVHVVVYVYVYFKVYLYF